MRHILQKVLKNFRFTPSYAEAAQRLAAAVESGQFSGTTPLDTKAIEQVLGFDSLDWIDMQMRSEEFGIKALTADELIRLLKQISRCS